MTEWALGLMCFFARRVIAALEREGETSLTVKIAGTKWQLSLRRTSPKGRKLARVQPTKDGYATIEPSAGVHDRSPELSLADREVVPLKVYEDESQAFDDAIRTSSH